MPVGYHYCPHIFPMLTAQILSKKSSTVGFLDFDRGEDKPQDRVCQSSKSFLYCSSFCRFSYWSWARCLWSTGSVNSPHSLCLRHLPLPWSGSAACTCPQWSSPACQPARWGQSASAGHPGGCPWWPRVGCCWTEVCYQLWRGEEEGRHLCLRVVLNTRMFCKQGQLSLP